MKGNFSIAATAAFAALAFALTTTQAFADQTDDEARQALFASDCAGLDFELNAASTEPLVNRYLAALNRKLNSQAVRYYLGLLPRSEPDAQYFASADFYEDYTDDYFTARLFVSPSGQEVFTISYNPVADMPDAHFCVFQRSDGSNRVTHQKSFMGDFYGDLGMTASNYMLDNTDTVHQYYLFMAGESDEAIMSIDHRYQWNGSGFEHKGAAIWSDNHFTGEGKKKGALQDPEFRRTKFALLDVDGDKFPELWLSTEDSKLQEIFSLKGTISPVVDSSHGPSTFSLAGTGVLSTDPDGCDMVYASLKNSRVAERYHSSCEMSGDDNEVCRYTINGKSVSEKQWKARTGFLDKTRELKPHFLPLLELH